MTQLIGHLGKVASLCGLMGVMAMSSGCQNAAPPVTTPPVATAPAPVTGEDVTFIVTQANRKTWMLHAKQATYSADQRLANLVGVNGEAYDSAEKAVARFTAPAGRYDQQSKIITLLNGVTATSVKDKPVVLKAPTLTWRSSSPDAEATGGITLNNQGFGTSTANTCRFSLDFTRIALTGNAITTVN
jgi:LPS export ABC transporter protein LptC